MVSYHDRFQVAPRIVFLDRDVDHKKDLKSSVEYYFSYHELGANTYKQRYEINRMVKEIEEKIK